MTVTTETSRIVYSGNGATTAFPTEFQFYSSADLVVTSVVTATGVETTKTITTHYTVSGGSGATGTVTMLTAPATGTRLVIQRVSDLVQDTDLIVQGEIPADSVETRFDKLTLIAQEAALDAVRALRTNKAQTGTINTEIPLLTDKAGYVVAINSTEDGFTLSNVASLSSSLDAVITSPAADDFLVYTSSAWRNRTAAQSLVHLGTISSAAIAAAYQPLDATLTALAALDGTAGLVTVTALNTLERRSVAVGTGLTIANPAGTAGNPTVGLDTILAAYVAAGAASANGLSFVTAANYAAMRALLDLEVGTDIDPLTLTGSWTPAITCGSSGTITLTGAVGRYIKKGRLVYASWGSSVDSVSSPLGTATLTGLPFTNTNADAANVPAQVHVRSAAASLTTPMAGLINQNATTMGIYKQAATGGLTGAAVAADFQAGTLFYGLAVFEASN